MDWVSNKCGGARFRELPDGKIEVEGKGIPYPNDANLKLLRKTWANWGPLIRKWAKARQIPVSNILAIMTQETGFKSEDKAKQAAAGSPAGAVGLMQVMPCKIFNPTSEIGKLVCTLDRADPNASVQIGSLILKKHLAAFGGLPAAASAYNSGGLRCATGKFESNVFGWEHEQNYAFKVSAFNNAAIDMGANQNFGASIWMLSALGFVLAGGVIFAAKKFSHR